MPVINVLSKQVAELIAAGEVIERPASVIKELVENSIDAGASSVIVEIKNGGVTFMRVTDDGCGIERDDVKNAFLRHATSKIAVQEDLDSIGTLGFRGEALASICAVSRVELITRSAKEETGTLYRLEGGEETAFAETGCPQGTTFVVRDLFYNVPARMKFLKKDVSESNTVSTLMDRMALSHPEIGFTLIRDGRQVLKTSGRGDLRTTVFQVFGKQFFEGLIPVSYEFQGITLSGFISDPASSNRASRNMQIFFVNGRYVRTKTGAAALDQAYKGFIMAGKYPACVLEMRMNCSSLDVNVHPAKLEIRFTDERPVYDCIYHGVRTALSRYDTRSADTVKPMLPVTDPSILAGRADKGSQMTFSYGKPAVSAATQEPEVFSPPPASFSSDGVNDPGDAVRSYYTGGYGVRSFGALSIEKSPESRVKEPVMSEAAAPVPEIKSRELTDIPFRRERETAVSLPFAQPVQEYQDITAPETKETAAPAFIDEKPDEPAVIEESLQDTAIVPEEERQEPALKYVGEAFSTYIIIEYDKDRLMFIDKHAAHERLIYERLKRDHSSSDAQMLLEPLIITLDKTEKQSVIENRQMLLDAGFDVEEFGAGTVLLRSVPALLDKLEINEAFLEIASYLAKHKKVLLSEKMEWIYANTACRAAIKAGNKNDPEELMELVRELERNPDVRYCPHGRPIYFFMSKTDLEKSFRRIV